MRISRIQIHNFRNIKCTDVRLDDVVTIIGGNNSGKSNFLCALTLPFLSDDNNISKNLSWADINAEARSEYYQFILDKKEEILANTLPIEDFVAKLPVVSVEVEVVPETEELYCVKDINYSVDDKGNILYGLRYEYKASHPEEILSQVRSILGSEQIDSQSIGNIQMNLLPTRMYGHSIVVPQKGAKVAYDTLRQFKYMTLSADRDNFSNTNERIGSRSLVKLLQMRLSDADLLTVEKEYSHFFDALKNLSGMDQVINWQENSEIPNAKDFFDNIDILPNMPPMTSIFSSVRLGYSGESLSLQGLGQRNLILLLVLLNSLYDNTDETAFRVLTVEEPEAHLCINNIRLITSFIRAFTQNNKTVQLFYSTHSTELINKVDPKNIIAMSGGKAFSLLTELGGEERDYLSKNPNTDIFKLLFARRCILVEGLTEELLIKAYLQSRPELSDIEIISFHKGFTKILDIWCALNEKTINRLGIIRDFDNEPKARARHDEYNNHPRICVETTKEYTLESEIVNAGDNYNLLKRQYGTEYNWEGLSAGALADDWRTTKSMVMLRLCHDLARGCLSTFVMPRHIQTVLDFMIKTDVGEDGDMANEN